MTGTIHELSWRGLIAGSSEGAEELLDAGPVTVYTGFDATAPSLQVGNLVPLMGLARLQRLGHSPIALIGGGTALIGDPSGKDKERKLLDPSEVEANVKGVRGQIERILDFDVRSNPARIENNVDWLGSLELIEFLRDTGKRFKLKYMLDKRSVQMRREKEEGISFAEFTYMLLQAYDFLKLYRKHGCLLQAGGSDQWGNITCGTELIRMKTDATAYGLIYPLVTDSSGAKLGKTAGQVDPDQDDEEEGGTIWLDPAKTSPFDFYQFWFNQADTDVIGHLKYFTWLRKPEIEDLAHATHSAPHERRAQRQLAREVTRIVHGDAAIAQAERAASILFRRRGLVPAARELREIASVVSSTRLPRARLEGDGMRLVDLIVLAGMAQGTTAARKLILGGGVYVSNRKAVDENQVVSLADAIDGEFLLLRKGKRSYHLIQLRR